MKKQRHHGPEITRWETAEYIGDMVSQLAKMADAIRLHYLAADLRKAADRADDACDLIRQPFVPAPL